MFLFVIFGELEYWEKIDDFILRSQKIAETVEKEEAFRRISSEISACDNRYLNDYIIALNYIQYEKVLDWIETESHRINNVSENWGHLAAMSHFDWKRAAKWLSSGRPLSLIALHALILCTTKGERLNQSAIMRQFNPRLSDNPGPDVIAMKLQEYLLIDNVPRTRDSVNTIIHNVFEV
jgi:hypothetical protein